MRIYTIKEIPVAEGANWERTFQIKIESGSIPSYGELDDWLRRLNNHFPKHSDYYYVLVAHYSNTISIGGHSSTFGRLQIDYYELRCSNKLAELFLHNWTIPEAEYKKNIEYVQARENRGRGYFDTNGEVFAYHDVEKLVATYRRSISSLVEQEAAHKARLDEEQARLKDPTVPRTPTHKEIVKAGLGGGLMGYSISDEACPRCNTKMVGTMNGMDCICGHTESL